MAGPGPVAGDDALETGWFILDELDGAELALGLDVAPVARAAATVHASGMATA